MSFALDVRNWEQRSQQELKTILRKVALELFTRVIMRSPVDTGRFRGNWQVEIGTPSGEVLDRFDKSGSQAVSDATSVVSKWEGDTAIFLFNNLPYAMRLEDGWSGQAAQGMVRVTLQEHPQIVEQEART